MPHAEIDKRRPVKIPVWWNYYVPFEAMLTDEDVYLSGLLCYANMISVGTTCFAEAGGPHPDAMARASSAPSSAHMRLSNIEMLGLENRE